MNTLKIVVLLLVGFVCACETHRITPGKIPSDATINFRSAPIDPNSEEMVRKELNGVFSDSWKKYSGKVSDPQNGCDINIVYSDGHTKYLTFSQPYNQPFKSVINGQRYVAVELWEISTGGGLISVIPLKRISAIANLCTLTDHIS